jgi:hypothetical protein
MKEQQSISVVKSVTLHEEYRFLINRWKYRDISNKSSIPPDISSNGDISYISTRSSEITG